MHTVPEDLERLRERNLGHNRSLAVREFAVGIEALERFVRKEPACKRVAIIQDMIRRHGAASDNTV